MSWVKLDDNFPDHPKVSGLSHGAFRCLVTIWCDSARYLTNGRVDESALSRRFRARSAAKWLRELHAAGLLERGENGYLVHDYLEYNPSRDKVIERRKADRVRQVSHRDKVRSHGVTPSAPPRPLLNRDSGQHNRDHPAYECPCGETLPDYVAFSAHLNEKHDGREPDVA